MAIVAFNLPYRPDASRRIAGNLGFAVDTRKIWTSALGDAICSTMPSRKSDPLPEHADLRTGRPTEKVAQPPGEIGAKSGPEPTRYGDWEVGGRCSDF